MLMRAARHQGVALLQQMAMGTVLYRCRWQRLIQLREKRHQRRYSPISDARFSGTGARPFSARILAIASKDVSDSDFPSFAAAFSITHKYAITAASGHGAE